MKKKQEWIRSVQDLKFWVHVYLHLIYGFIYITERIPGFNFKFKRNREK